MMEIQLSPRRNAGIAAEMTLMLGSFYVDGYYPAIEVKSEITMEVKLTLNPLWLNKVQNIIPKDSPQLTKQKTSKRTKKNDPTVSAVRRRKNKITYSGSRE